MLCPRCNANNPDGAKFCVACGADLAGNAASANPYAAPAQRTTATDEPPMRRPNVSNYLVQAILVTLCCCLPFGIVSIVYAAQVNSRLDAGDYAGAVAASDKAKMWAWIGFGIGIVVNFLIFGIQIIAGVLGAMSH